MQGPTPKELGRDFSIKEFDIERNGTKFHFKSRRLSWYQEEKIAVESTMFSQTGQYRVDTPELNLKLMQACLVEAPFDITKENLMLLEPDVKEEIIKNIVSPRLTEDISKKLSGQ